MITTFVLLTLAIILHELGHFGLAKCFGIRVRRFCIFFDLGFPLLRIGKRWATELCVGWLPLGGYVTFDDPDKKPYDKRHFWGQKPWKRLGVYLGGVAVNLLVAYVSLFAWVNVILKPENRPATISVMKMAGEVTVRRMGDIRHSFIVDHIPGSKAEQRKVVPPRKHQGRVHQSDTDQHKVSQHADSASGRLPLPIWLWCFADINLIFFMLNLLPIPPLDGAKALFSLYEMVFRKPVNKKVQIIVCAFGSLLLIGCTLFDIYTIIRRL